MTTTAMESKEMKEADGMTPKEVIEEMKRYASMDDYTPLTLRIPQTMFDQIEEFCELTGVKKAVLLRRLVEIGWAFITTEGDKEEK